MIETQVSLALDLCCSCYSRLQDVKALVEKSSDFLSPHISTNGML